MNAKIPTGEPRLSVEQRLQRALVEEAGRCAQREPARLAAACRAPRQPRLPARHHPWRWAAAAAALLLLALPLRLSLQKDSRAGVLDRPAAVSPVIDREALYAALPHIPAPNRPAPPSRLVAERVIVLPP